MSAELVATLIAEPSTRISPDILSALTRDIASARIAWLVEHKVADVFCADMALVELYAHVRKCLRDEPVDVIVQVAADRRKKLLVADMESTIIEQEMLDEMADAIGQRAKVVEITRRAMNGEIDFSGALRERVALFKGQPVALLEEMASHITLMPGAAELLTVMKAHRARAWLVTGGFSCFAKPVAERLGFDKCIANDLVIRDGLLTGGVAEPIVDREGKKAALAQACRDLHVPLHECLAIGDGANDVPMLTACNEGGGLGVAYQAKPKVRAVIPHQINYGDLSALLYAQGYSGKR